MSDREKASDIDNAAVTWAVRAERGLTAEERSELDHWLESDSRRLGAFVRAQASWIHAERAAALGKMPEQEPVAPIETVAGDPQIGRPISRRLMLGGGGAIAASVVAIGLIGWQRYRIIESGVGETRHIALAAGTSLTLDTDTRVDIAAGSDDRSFILRRGRLFLEMAESNSLPISVSVNDLVIEAVRSAFELQFFMSEPLVALVTRGAMIVSQGAGFLETRRKLTVVEGRALTVASRGQLSAGDVHPIATANLAKLLAWRDGMLSFGGETLGEAVRAFDRYSPYRIAVVDPELASQRITGLFKADDPKGFATAIAATFGAIVDLQGNNLQLTLKKVPPA